MFIYNKTITICNNYISVLKHCFSQLFLLLFPKTDNYRMCVCVCEMRFGYVRSKSLRSVKMRISDIKKYIRESDFCLSIFCRNLDKRENRIFESRLLFPKVLSIWKYRMRPWNDVAPRLAGRRRKGKKWKK